MRTFVCQAGWGGRTVLMAYGKRLGISKPDCTSRFAYGPEDTASLCCNLS